MKSKALLVLIPVFIAGFGLGIGVFAYSNHLTLDDCAKGQNVYACKFQAIPITPPKVIIQQVDILPPPVDSKKNG